MVGKTTRGGNDQGGDVLGAKRLGEEMVCGRNDPDSCRFGLVTTTTTIDGHWSFRPITISAHDHFGPYHFGPLLVCPRIMI